MLLFGLGKPDRACFDLETPGRRDVGIVAPEYHRDEITSVVVEIPLVVRANPMVDSERKAKEDERPSHQIGALWPSQFLSPTNLKRLEWFRHLCHDRSSRYTTAALRTSGLSRMSPSATLQLWQSNPLTRPLTWSWSTYKDCHRSSLMDSSFCSQIAHKPFCPSYIKSYSARVMLYWARLRVAEHLRHSVLRPSFLALFDPNALRGRKRLHCVHFFRSFRRFDSLPLHDLPHALGRPSRKPTHATSFSSPHTQRTRTYWRALYFSEHR